MSRRWTTWVALALWLLMLVLVIGIVSMKVAGWHGAGNTSSSGLVALLVAFLAFATMGALVAAHVPENPLGWMFLVIALLVAANGAGESYAYQGLVHDPGSLPLALPVAWYYAWGWLPALGTVAAIPLLYPTGRVPGPRWRPVLWAVLACVGAVTLAAMVAPGPIDGGGSKLPDNPLGIDRLQGAVDATFKVPTVILLLLLPLVAASVVVRFRRARGDERQQMKWMAVATAILVASVVVPPAVGFDAGGDVLFSFGVVQLPIAVGIALFKYRLYDIDRVISRTLVYGSLTVVLAAIYVGLVLAGQALFSSFAGGSSLAIAVSTLVVAALFLPVRARVQRFVDRRFNRHRYDAQRTLEAFGARLREQVDVDRLSGELAGVVSDTMQPSEVTVWLRAAASR